MEYFEACGWMVFTIDLRDPRGSKPLSSLSTIPH